MRPPPPPRARCVDRGSLAATPLRMFALACCLALLPLACRAQSPSSKPETSAPEGTSEAQESQAHPYTLHVYTDLLQIPTLVLDRHGAPLTGADRQDFRLQLDAGPVFRPTAVHMEGTEPLTLAIVLDASGAERDLIDALPHTPAHGFPGALLPQDHVSVFAFDCHVLRSTLDTAAAAAIAHEGIARILASPALHKTGAPTHTCRDAKRLWDAVATAAFDLSTQPGRRAILVVTDGEDGGSKVTLRALHDFATAKSIAVFALREQSTQASAVVPGSPGRGTWSTSYAAVLSNDDLLDNLAQSTGGLILPTDSRNLAQHLDRVITLLRSRYILQFPRPADGTGGLHHLDVRVDERGATVRAAGIAFPIRDAALMNDPSTVPTDTSRMPVVGKHKPGS